MPYHGCVSCCTIVIQRHKGNAATKIVEEEIAKRSKCADNCPDGMYKKWGTGKKISLTRHHVGRGLLQKNSYGFHGFQNRPNMSSQVRTDLCRTTERILFSANHDANIRLKLNITNKQTYFLLNIFHFVILYSDTLLI